MKGCFSENSLVAYGRSLYRRPCFPVSPCKKRFPHGNNVCSLEILEFVDLQEELSLCSSLQQPENIHYQLYTSVCQTAKQKFHISGWGFLNEETADQLNWFFKQVRGIFYGEII